LAELGAALGLDDHEIVRADRDSSGVVGARPTGHAEADVDGIGARLLRCRLRRGEALLRGHLQLRLRCIVVALVLALVVCIIARWRAGTPGRLFHGWTLEIA